MTKRECCIYWFWS